MSPKIKILLVVNCFLVLQIKAFTQIDSTTILLISKMHNAIFNLKTITYVFTAKERFNNTYNQYETTIKNQFNPYCVYLVSHKSDGSKGPEVIYCDQANNNEAIVAINQFPYINLNLHPHSWLLVKDRHHTIDESGLTYLARMLNYNTTNTQLAKTQISNVKTNGNTYIITLENPNYTIQNYISQNGESLHTIAAKFYLARAHLAQLNKNFDAFEELPAGTKIKITPSYAKKVVLTLNKQTYFPEKLEVYDHIGLFENYWYRYLNVNKPFDPIEFSQENPSYGF